MQIEVAVTSRPGSDSGRLRLHTTPPPRLARMTRRPLFILTALLVLTAGCSDYNFSPEKNPEPGGNDDNDDDGDDPDGDTDDGGDTGDDTGSGIATPTEVCNGVDDDGDGDIDEGFPDTDGDGIADCVDESCEAATALAGTVTIDDTCLTPDVVVTDPWDVTIEWQWSNLSTATNTKQVISVPTVGHLVDTNGDGTVDSSDTPTIAVVAFDYNTNAGVIVALDGATGAEHWVATGVSPWQGVALADANNDGVTDVLAIDSSGHPVAYNGDGTLLWRSSSSIGYSYAYYPQVAVADLDGDGNPEVLAQDIVVDGLTGALELSGMGPASGYVPYWIPTAADLDQDGYQEIIHGDAVYDSNGNYLWSAGFAGSYGHWAAVVDYDGDPEGEVIMVGGGYLGVYDPDGTQLSLSRVGTSQPGAPCVADFDGDGDAEIGWASSNTFQVSELTGTVLWSKSIDDSSGLAACSGYDVDGDGAYEVLFADQATFYIFDGATGSVNFSQGGHASGTLWEYPSVADIDNDGSAEIIIGSNNYWMSGWSGITVFGHNGSGWMKAGPTWHTHDFAVTNINSDGSVPATPTPWWQVYNVYRARPAVDTAAMNLRPVFVDVCAASCEDGGLVEATVVLENDGGVDSEEDVTVSLYADDGGTLTLIDQQVRPGAVEGGTSTASLSFVFSADALGTDGLRVIVDDDGTASGIGEQDECDESDNEDSWTDPVCP